MYSFTKLKGPVGTNGGFMICIVVLMELVLMSARGQAKLDTTISGLPYKNFTTYPGSRISIGDVVTVNLIEKAEGGEILVDTYSSGVPVKIVIKKAQNITDLMDFLILLTEKDSAIVRMPSDSVFFQYEAFRPSFIPKGSWLDIFVKIERVQSFEEVMADALKDLTYRRNLEKQQLNQYLKKKAIAPIFTASGLGFIVINKTSTRKPQVGDTVEINYVARTLDEVVIDTSIEEEAKKVGLDQPGREYGPINVAVGLGEVIPGWDEGLLLMDEGSKVRFFIPSKLAFDFEGSGEVIAPFTTLIIDVELLKIKKRTKNNNKFPVKEL